MSREYVTTGFAWARNKTKNFSGPEDTALLSKRSVKCTAERWNSWKSWKDWLKGKGLMYAKKQYRKLICLTYSIFDNTSHHHNHGISVQRFHYIYSTKVIQHHHHHCLLRNPYWIYCLALMEYWQSWNL